MNFSDTQEAIHQTKQERKVLIAAHRGTCGGYIVPNTIPAYENALLHQADIIEVDTIMSRDGFFYAFHDGMEQAVLGISQDLRMLSAEEIDGFRCLNSDGTPINQKVERLDHVLEHFKGRCLINIDRSWFYWEEIIRLLQRHDMADQVILKSHVDRYHLGYLQDNQVDLMYMPIVDTMDQLNQVLSYDLHLLAVEMIFRDRRSPLISADTIAGLKEKRILTWANPIKINEKLDFTALLDDFRAITVSREENWGQLLDMGFDILQTDWPLLLRKFVDERRV